MLLEIFVLQSVERHAWALGRTPVRAPGPGQWGGATTTTQYHDHASFDPSDSEVCQGRGSLFFGRTAQASNFRSFLNLTGDS